MLIIYGSNYGYTRRYAEKFAELSGEAGGAYDYREFPRTVKAGDKVIYFAAMYAGGLKGLKKTAKKLVKAGAKMYIVTVGLGDPVEEETRENLKKAVAAALPQDIPAMPKVFNLRGGIDYGKLKPVHKLLMKLLYKMESKTPEEKRSPETRAFMETYGKSADFTDFSKLNGILEAVIKDN